MLDADLAAEQELQRQQTEAQIARLQQPQGQIAERSSARDEEVRRLKRWAKGKKAPDVDAFHSHLLEREEKMAALGIPNNPKFGEFGEFGEVASGEDAPFPASDAGWSHYP
jgi:hypothetical protein